MAFDFDGTDDYLSLAAVPASAAPLTMCCWFNADNVTTTARLLPICDGAGNNGYELTAAGTVAGDPVRFSANVTTLATAETTTGYTAGSWFHALGIEASSTSRSVYINGGSSATNTTSKSPSGMDRIGIGARPTTTPSNFFNGKIADAAVWNVVLTASEIAALAAGWSPRLIRPAALMFYAPLIREGTINLRGGALTATSAPVAFQHPRILYPRLYIVGVPTAAAAGIAFDAAANSGDVAAASSYSGSASWAGTDRALAVDVSMLGSGVTVTAMTYGGAACTLVGVQSTVTSFGRVEQWIIKQSDSGAPAAGANTLVVTLSGSIEFAVEWTSYTGVHQSLATEGFNSAQATNGAGAADATVDITPVAANTFIHAALVASDTSVTANQTTRNNISGTLGSGANEDTGPVVTPAATTMSYTGVGAFVTWAIAGYALRPVAASGPPGAFFSRYYYDRMAA